LLYNDQEANGLKWISQMGGQSYPSLSDPGARVAIDYGLYGVPETFVVDRGTRGTQVHRLTNAIRLSKLIDSLLANGDSSRVAPAEFRRTPP
jgi:cytochrome c biogenesis protein CcmG/thiol:disulfide interchange protein DsbE